MREQATKILTPPRIAQTRPAPGAVEDEMMEERPSRITLTSIQRYGRIRPGTSAFQGRAVRIWSDQWRMWWRSDAAGYTQLEGEAGLYTFENAVARTHHCGREKQIIFELVGAI